jgi:N utilization substance protein B
MGVRRKARECVLQMLYQLDMGGADVKDVVSRYWMTNDEDEEVRAFADELMDGVAKNLSQIDDSISGHSTNWKLSRMASVDKNILRLAVYELMYREDIPVKVTINEAVEIAKKFGTAESGAFVNGVLDNIAKGVAAHKRDVESTCEE